MADQKYIRQEIKVLLVEDDSLQANTVLSMLKKLEDSKNAENSISQKWRIHWCKDITKALQHIKEHSFDLILLDFQLKENVGVDLLRMLSSLDSDMYNSDKTSIVMLSAYSNTSRVVEALKLGACDFLEKPLKFEQLRNIFDQYVDMSQNKTCETVQKVSQEQKIEMDTYSSLEVIVHPKSPLLETLSLGKLVSKKTCPIFLRGESGTGKEVLSNYIHNSSSVKGKFVPINCGALSENLIESTFFGHKKGAFTGADADYEGCFLQADNGTLFLDEVGELPLHIQTRLLRVLQEKKVRPLGGDQELPVSFRLISATHKDLKSLVEKGCFREDLYYRLCVFPIEIPALRDRAEDVPLLAEFFLKQHGLSEEEVAHWVHAIPSCLNLYSWPGNVRELRNLVDRLVVLKEVGQGWEEALKLSDGGSKARLKWDKESTEMALRKRREIGEEEILEALQKNQYHRARTAAALGISRRNLQYRLARME